MLDCSLSQSPKDSFSTDPDGRYVSGEVNIHYRTPVRHDAKPAVAEEELRRRQAAQMREFYANIEAKKRDQLRQDAMNRKHHDTLL